MKKQIHILGGGISGLTLALQLLRRFKDKCDVTVFEMNETPGGMAGSFRLDGLTFDYGSHRLHSATPSHIFDDLQKFMGDDLLKRPRNGRIRLLDTYIAFPPKPAQMISQLPWSFTFGFIKDMLLSPLSPRLLAPTDFAQALRNDLGSTICNTFYFPFAKKLWGIEPHEIAPVQARRRVASQGMLALLKKVFSSKTSEKNWFYYPRHGFGQLADTLAQECKKRGVKIQTATQVTALHSKGNRLHQINTNAGKQSSNTDLVFSTLPIPVLLELLVPRIGSPIQQTVDSLRYRSLIMLYLILDTEQFTPFDAHYFPETDLIFSRISEPNNYTDSPVQGKTGLCVEIPCFYNDDTWNASKDYLKSKVLADLEKAGLPVRCEIINVETKPVRFAYPLYELKYGWKMTIINTFLEGITNLVSIGRQGLFLHDNVHHDMDMAYTAVSCIREDMSFDTSQWLSHASRFKDQVVED